MNGLIIFNNDDGTMLLQKSYIERFGFDCNVKESHDPLYLSTMLFTLYCNGHFIQKTPQSHNDLISSIVMNNDLMLLFHSNPSHPYILCTVHSTQISYKTSTQMITMLSHTFEAFIQTNPNIVGNVKQFKQMLNQMLGEMCHQMTQKLLDKCLRTIINSWVICDNQYFESIDAKYECHNVIKDIDMNENENQVKKDKLNEFDEVVVHHKAQIHPRKMTSESEFDQASNKSKSLCEQLFCCPSYGRQKTKMDPLLKYELKPNENFENLKAAIKYLETDCNCQLSVDSNVETKVRCCKWMNATQTGEYWYIRWNNHCLMIYLESIQTKMYPMRLNEFVDRNYHQIIDLFKWLELHNRS
eukprot:480327_1